MAANNSRPAELQVAGFVIFDGVEGGEAQVHLEWLTRPYNIFAVAVWRLSARHQHGKVEFLDSTGLGVLVGGLKRVRAHDGSLDLVCTQERILKIFRITGLTKVFGIHDTVDEAIKARKSEK